MMITRFDLSKKTFKKLLKNSKPNILIHLASRTVSGSKTNKEDKYQLKIPKLTKNLIEQNKSINYVQKLIFAGTIEEYEKLKVLLKKILEQNQLHLMKFSCGMFKFCKKI